jgi:hypothetical protein
MPSPSASACPVCSSQALAAILHRDRLPVMQNVCYPTRDLARDSPRADFDLSACCDCGFLFNSAFDPAVMRYDVGYDNHVESPTFEAYYEALARQLVARFDLDRGGVVYDVGCGAGTFLKVLCAVCPAVTGIGIDPACEPVDAGNRKLIRGTFSKELIGRDARLVVLRHVLEHIDRPVEFMTQLRGASGNAPIFVEVPDARWIFRHGAFWDFCYEHCNYFVPSTLRNTLRRAGLRVIDSAVTFADQYQWALCEEGSDELEDDGGVALADARQYSEAERRYLASARAAVADGNRVGACALWGMATKGVVFASLLSEGGAIAGGVDSNPRKHGLFAPGSGLQIHDPAWLAGFGGNVTAIVMNPNYLDEIRRRVEALRIQVKLITL